MNKAQLRTQIIARLRADLLVQTRAAALARDEATHEESRAENKYDTRGQEAAYVAEGQARLAAEIDESIALYTSLPLPAFAPDAPIAVGAGVEITDARGRVHAYFIGPRGGGMELEIDGRPLLVVTPASPLGRQLLGRRTGDAVVLPGRPPSPGRITAVE